MFLGPPGTGKTHLATGLAIRACQAGHRVLFATASEWVDRLAAAHHDGTLQARAAQTRAATRCWSSTYADTATMPSRVLGCFECGVLPRHSHRVSRNASTLSVGRYLPGRASAGVVSASAFSLMVMSAWM